MPQPDANGIIAIVKQKYPNATIVEIEREKGLQEVTILDENKEKEVYFNERNEWMGTSWDVQVANLPEAVKIIHQCNGDHLTVRFKILSVHCL